MRYRPTNGMEAFMSLRQVLMGAAFAALQASAAGAATLDWSYSGPGGSGGGTLTATTTDDITYFVSAVTGTANGQTIAGISAYDGPDQKVFPVSPVQVTTLGFAFSVGDGTQSYNLYEDDGRYDPTSPFFCGAVYCLLGPGDTATGGAGDPVVALDSFTVSIASVPEPATWGMMLVGFGGLGAAMRTSRRAKAAAATA
jgi:hypothetical protein